MKGGRERVEGRGWKVEDRGKKAENKGQNIEIGRQLTIKRFTDNRIDVRSLVVRQADLACFRSPVSCLPLMDCPEGVLRTDFLSDYGLFPEQTA